jgi:hypothetical protein
MRRIGSALAAIAGQIPSPSKIRRVPWARAMARSS